MIGKIALKMLVAAANINQSSIALVKLLGRFPGENLITEPVKVLHTKTGRTFVRLVAVIG